ncbi:MAG: SpoIID/LytB domain-containing protein [Clostridium sp.]|nr:SpoIID/LytB domain-containing protein [Clostridium sp.]MCM1287786.1 SpoIID/LytB domain-containing protein [Clostridium sp.]
MKDKLLSSVLAGVLCLVIPYLMTIVINGGTRGDGSKITKISTGKDVIVRIDGQNELIDVEQYILGVLPGVVSADADAAVIEAQAVAVRTKIYHSMGSDTIIDAGKLDFTYFSEKELKEKLGEKNYNRIMSVYENAVENTVGKIM